MNRARRAHPFWWRAKRAIIYAAVAARRTTAAPAAGARKEETPRGFSSFLDSPLFSFTCLGRRLPPFCFINLAPLCRIGCRGIQWKVSFARPDRPGWRAHFARRFVLGAPGRRALHSGGFSPVLQELNPLCCRARRLDAPQAATAAHLYCERSELPTWWRAERAIEYAAVAARGRVRLPPRGQEGKNNLRFFSPS